MRKKVLFIVDKPNWAYEYMVKSWMIYLLPIYDCYLIYQQDYGIKENTNNSKIYKWWFNIVSSIVFFVKKIRDKKDFQFFTTSHYFFKKHTKKPIYQFMDDLGNLKIVDKDVLHYDTIVEMAFYFQYTCHHPFTANKKVVGIFTDTFPHDGPTNDILRQTDRSKLIRKDFYKTYLEPYNHIIVGGGNLYNDYKELTDNISFVYGIYGEENFLVNNHVGEKEYLTIGWTGTPKRKMKGFEEFIIPAIENVKKTGRDIRLKTKFSGSYEDLYTFYQDVDLIVIASSADSGPSLFAEASLSGVPSISTKIGLPLMGISDGENGLFLSREVESIEKGIITLYDDRTLLKSFSKQIRNDYLNNLGNKITVKNILKILK